MDPTGMAQECEAKFVPVEAVSPLQRYETTGPPTDDHRVAVIGTPQEPDSM